MSGSATDAPPANGASLSSVLASDTMTANDYSHDSEKREKHDGDNGDGHEHKDRSERGDRDRESHRHRHRHRDHPRDRNHGNSHSHERHSHSRERHHHRDRDEGDRERGDRHHRHRDDKDRGNRHRDEREDRDHHDRDRGYHREDRDRHQHERDRGHHDRDRHRDRRDHAGGYRDRDHKRRSGGRGGGEYRGRDDRSPKRRRFSSRSPDSRLRREPSPADPNMPDIYKYTFVSPIGEGVFGNVFLARDSNNVKLAIKRLKLSSAEHYDSHYKREIEVLKDCNHKNIVKLREVVKNNKNEKFLVLEYCPLEFGATLNNIVLPSQLKNVINQLLVGVEYIHSKNVIHRDLKPDNLLFSPNGILKIADFGSSRIFREGSRYTPGMVTLRYRAPEIFLGATNYTTAIDIWSVGCIATEVLLGRPMLDGISELEQIDKMCTVLGSPSETIWPGFSRYPNSKRLVFPVQEKQFIKKYLPGQSEQCYTLMLKLLTYNPATRITATEALKHAYWKEDPGTDPVLNLI